MLPLPSFWQGQPVFRKMTADLSIELELWQLGYRAIAGVDEAGRGAWAGPVAAAAAILPTDLRALASLLGQVDDSKRLTPAARDRMFDLIRAQAMAVGVGFGSVQEIEAFGILNATKAAMMRAIAGLAPQPDFVLIDYLSLRDLSCPQRGLVHGDALSLSIAAASIVAKVSRDRWMAEQEAHYPGYDFGRHKGYGTEVHWAALERLGPCPLHRRTFRPVAAVTREF
jgi:ribonuclease HII